MPFDPKRFEQLRDLAELALGAPFHHYALATSTNDEARRFALAGEDHGALFVADSQSDGRGRHGKTWLSSPDAGLLFSLLVRPPLPVDQWTALPLVAGLAVASALEPHVEAELTVKWPNDVLAGRSKLAGVLMEAELSAPRAAIAILGIGVNVSALSFSGDFKATSLALLAPESRPLPTREELLVAILEELQTWLAVFFKEGATALASALNRRDALRGQHVRVGDVKGVGAGIDRHGRLLVRTDGEDKPVASGTVVWD